MKKVFRLEELDSANCAAKMESGIARLEGVQSVSVSFMTQKLTLEADDAVFDDVLARAEKLVRRIEPDCRIVR